MASFNRVILMGHLTRDIELRYTQGGTAVADLGLAVNDRVKQGDEWVDKTMFIEVAVWSRTAEIADEYLSKGSAILIEGRLQQETWVDRSTQAKRSKHKIVCDKLQMLSRSNGAGNASTKTTDADVPQQAAVVGAEGPDDAPF